MYKKRYGRVTVRAWLTMELEQSNPIVMLIFGALMLFAGLAVRFVAGTPYRMLLETGIGDFVPPAFLMCVAWSLSFFIIGCAAGFILMYRLGGCDAEKYKGCMFFVLLAVLELLWYPTFFAKGWVFLSILECILILCLAICITGCFYRVSKFAGMLFLLHDIWLIYMLILNFAVFFRI
ncbi:MAG: tryptophan-rich sensory protein [Clostridia bacterium]|nr:tryptophan-rich sensory protein [Clostridia bacterium]